MIKNYLNIAVRNLLKHKAFSFINICGLAIGMAAFLMILQYVRYELSYDNFHQNGSRIYRMQQDRYNKGVLSTQWASGAAGIGNSMKESFPEVESYAKLRQTGAVISRGEKKFTEEKVYFASDSFLPMFSYRLLKGNAANALTEPNTAVLTESTAKKYFAGEDPMGKTIRLDNRDEFKITGIVADLPANTHLKFDILLSFKTYVAQAGPESETTFDWDGFMTYVMLKPGTDAAALEKKIPAMIDRKIGAQMKERDEQVAYKLQPMTSIHLYSDYMMEAEINGDGRSVNFLLIIAFFIIVIAWINYINLSTARALDRAKEVGMRKVMGSHRLQLISQFMFESILINSMAVLLAFILVLVFLPLFNSITGKEVHFSLLLEPSFWLAMAALYVAGSFLAGIYPAFVLSSYKPISVLKGKLVKTKAGAYLRQSLVIVQFAASIALMVGTFCVYRQLAFMKSQDLGLQIDQTLVLKGPRVTDSMYSDRLNTFKTEMMRLPGIKSMAASTSVPGSKIGWNAGGIKLVGAGNGETNQYRILGIDYDFLQTFGLKIIKGRNFSKKYSTDPKSVLLNESALKLMGFTKPADALNKQIDFWGEVYTIVGVVSNHHQESLKQPYDQHIFRLIPDSRNFYSLKLQPGSHRETAIIGAAEAKWKELFPGNPFEYFFLDEHFQKQYEADRQFGKTFGLFASLAIIVACLGLLGLTSFVTTQRTKEIGIRKISGAGISNILLLLTKDFVRPVFIAFVIATPITYYLLTKWLENYAFKITLGPLLFILPALLIFIIAVLTISTQTIKAASANPVKSLRSE